ncbi:MAG: hypothetical protein KDB23_31255 [Planctomycetales bacterium]|nr:hypothetical protein [Planctomycetales bacterium]
MIRLLSWVLGVTWIAASPVWAEMVIQSYSANTNDRFDSGNFLGAGYDWTGVGKNGSQWATMISPTQFLSAEHAHPSGQVTFWLSNSSTGPSVTLPITTGQAIAGTDLWLGTLASPVPSEIAIYPIAASSVNLATGLGSYEDQLTYMVGTRGTLNFAVGTNRADVTDVDQTVDGLTTPFDAIGYFHDNGSSINSTDSETLVQGGDSGAPSFIVEGGQLKLLGIHSYLADNITSANFSALFDYRSADTDSLLATGNHAISFDIFVPNYTSQIATVTAVPEPAAWMFLSLGGCLVSLASCHRSILRSVERH